MKAHQLDIVGTRKLDGSLIWKCLHCKKVGLGLIGECKVADWPKGRRKKVTK